MIELLAVSNSWNTDWGDKSMDSIKDGGGGGGSNY